METSYCHACPYVVYICAVRSYWGRARKILQTLLKRGNSRLGKLAIDTLDSSMMRKRLLILRSMERIMDLHVVCLRNSCQGIDTGILFKLNYSIHQTLALHVIQVLE